MFNRGSNTPAPSTAPAATVPQPAAVSVEGLLAPSEELVAQLSTDNRDIAVTTRRLIITEHSGGWSAVSRDQISAFEISDAGDGGTFVKMFFGGGLSRTMKTRTAEDAALLVSVVAR